MGLSTRLTRILANALVGGVMAGLAAAIFMLVPPSFKRGAPPKLQVAVLVDSSMGSQSQAVGLSGTLMRSLNEHLRSVPKAASDFLATMAPGSRDLAVYTFDSTVHVANPDAVAGVEGNAAADGAISAALGLAQRDLGKHFGPKLAIIWLDRPSLGPEDLKLAQQLKILGWEIRVYGTVTCDAEAMRLVASDVHFAFREPKLGLEKALKQASRDYSVRSVALADGFKQLPALTRNGKILLAGLVGFFLAFGLSLLRGAYYRKPLGGSVVRGLTVAVIAGVVAGLGGLASSPMLWPALVGLGAAFTIVMSAPNTRGVGLVLGLCETGVLLGWAGLPMDTPWGAAILGLAIATLATVAEELMRKQYLEVRDGKRTMLIDLGRKEVAFGSDPGSAYVMPDGNPRVAAIRLGADGPYRVDTLSGRNRTLHAGEAQRIGRLVVLAHGRRERKASATMTKADVPLVLRIQESFFDLPLGAKFSALELPVAKGSAGGVVAEVTDNPAIPGVLGLTNRSGAYWSATLPNGTQTPIPPGRTVRIAAGTHISFGSGEGSIEASGQARTALASEPAEISEVQD